MPQQQLLIGLLIGSAFIAVGLIPGLLPRLLSGVSEGIQEFRYSLSPLSAREPRDRNSYDGKRLPGQGWLAAWGVLLIVLSLFAYFSN